MAVRNPIRQGTVAEAILAQLALWGVKRIYGVPGDAILGLLDALARQEAIRFISVTHEAMAAMMASAEAKLTEGIGVCVATMGPGMVQLLNGLADAAMDQVPVLALTGQGPLDEIGLDEKQMIDQQVMVAPLARFSSLVVHPNAAVDLLHKALQVASVERGVSHLSIPKDLFTKTQPYTIRPPIPNTAIVGSYQTQKVILANAHYSSYGESAVGNSLQTPNEAPAHSHYPSSGESAVSDSLQTPNETTAHGHYPSSGESAVDYSPPLSSEGLAWVVQRMQAARRPLIVAGRGAWPARGNLIALAKRWGAGIITSLGAKGIVEETDPVFMGGLGEGGNPAASFLLKETDLILMVGATWWPKGFVPMEAPVIQIDRSSAQLRRRIRAEMGIIAKAETVLPVLYDGLNSYTHDDMWRKRLQEVHQSWMSTVEMEWERDGSPLPPTRVMKVLSKVVPQEAILTVDTGDHTVWFNRSFRPRGQKILFSGTWRTMGFALPAAYSAKLQHPETPVFAIIGDGGLTMFMGELITAARYQLPVTVMVMKNNALQMEKSSMIVEGYRPLGVDLTYPDFAEAARACGWQAIKAEDEQVLAGAVREALAATGPTLIEVPVQGLIPPLAGIMPLDLS